MASEIRIDLSQHFVDLDEGDTLVFSATHTGLVGSTVDVTGNILTLTGPAAGGMPDDGQVTVIAQSQDDQGNPVGNPVSDTFNVGVIVAQVFPLLATPLADLTIHTNATVRVDLDLHFSPSAQRGDFLTYTAVTSGHGDTITLVNADVVILGHTISRTRYLDLTAGAFSETENITVVATNTYDETVMDSLVMTVTNDAPVRDSEIPDQVFAAFGATLAIDLSQHFSDPNNHALTYTVSAPSLPVGTTALIMGNMLNLSVGQTQGVGSVQITATDTFGAVATDTFQLIVDTLPRLTTPIPNQNVGRNISRDVDLGSFFTEDPGGTLTYTVATSGLPSGTGATVVGATLTLTGGASFGNGTVTVTATDNRGNSVADTFTLAVSDAPFVSDPIPDQSLAAPTSIVLDLRNHFSGASALTYTVDSASLPVGSTAEISGRNLTVTAGPTIGSGDVTIRATDTGGLFVEDTFSVQVVNAVPVLSAQIPDQTMYFGDSQTIDLSQHFSDPNNHALTYTVSAPSLPVGTTALIMDSTLTLTAGMALGSGDVTIRATDTESGFTEGVFEVNVGASRALPVGSIGAMAYHDGGVYITNPDGLHLVDLSDPTNTSGPYGLIGPFPADLEVAGAMGSFGGGLYVIEDTPLQEEKLWRINPANPADETGVYGLVGALPSQFPLDVQSPRDMASHSGRLYLAETRSVWRFSDPANSAGAAKLSGFTPDDAEHMSGFAAYMGSFYVSASEQYTGISTGLWRINPADLDDETGVYGLVNGSLPSVSDMTTVGNTIWGVVNRSRLFNVGLYIPVRLVSAIPDQTVTAGDAVNVNLGTYFGSALSYAAVPTGLPTGATVTVTGDILTVTAGQTTGAGTVTVTATGITGSPIVDTFDLTVEAAAMPEPTGWLGQFAVSSMQGLASHADSMYAVNSAENLYRINPDNPSDETGDFGFVGTFHSAVDNPRGMTLARTVALYMLDRDRIGNTAQGRLWRVDTALTLASTNLGPIASFTQPGALASHAGSMYATDTTLVELWRINPDNPERRDRRLRISGCVPIGFDPAIRHDELRR